jgi:hypothetical protein
MKNRFWIIMFGIFLLINIISISAEMNFWSDTLINQDTQIVRYHGYFQFDDTSVKNIGRHKSIPITIQYLVEPLPFNLTYGNVDYCNFTMTNYHNIYGTSFVAFEGFSGGDLLNTTINVTNLYFGTGSLQSGYITVDMYDKDSIILNMDCHYTDINSLFQENVLVGSFSTFFPQFSCDECSQYTIEQLSNEIASNENITASSVQVYTKIQSLIGFNWQIWLIISWLIKIALIVVALSLAFAGIYYVYKFLNDLGRSIK